MTIEEAIKLAVEGGWKDVSLLMSPLIIHRKFGVETATKMVRAYVFLDPKFWQCLGKALGWHSDKMFDKNNRKETWRGQWHELIDRLAFGGTAEDYFAQLK